jgi:hypothetical protein
MLVISRFIYFIQITDTLKFRLESTGALCVAVQILKAEAVLFSATLGTICHDHFASQLTRTLLLTLLTAKLMN